MNAAGFAVILALSVTYVDTGTLNDAQNLRISLINSRRYDRHIRPIANQFHTLYVSVHVSFYGIGGLDEVNEVLTSYGFLRVIWKDDQLTWNPERFGNLTLTFFSEDEIWRPDIVLKNDVEESGEIGSPYYYLYVNHKGRVLWTPYSVFKTKCSLDLTYFPFDKQRCNVSFISWNYSPRNLYFNGGGVMLYKYQEHSVWAILNTTSVIETIAGEQTITFILVLKRKPMFFLVTTALPIILLGLLNTFVFIVPVDAGEKIGFSTTVFLAFAVFLSILTSEVPKNSEYVSLLSVFVTGQLVQSALVVLLSSVQIRIHHRSEETPMSNFYQKLVNISMILQRKRKRLERMDSTNTSAIDLDSIGNNSEITSQTNLENRDCDRKIIGWKDVSNAIDFFAFSVFQLLVILWSLICFLVAAGLG